MKRTTPPGQSYRASKTRTQREQSLMRRMETVYQAVFDAEPRLKAFTVEVRVTKKGEPTAFPNNREQMLIGWEEIAEFLGLSEVGVCVMHSKSLKGEGVVFKKKVHKVKNNQRRSYWCAFPNAIVAWSIRQSLKRNGNGEQLHGRDGLVEEMRRLLAA